MQAPVSVVIPCFNCEDTIRAAVISVARQTWQPVEVILVDDGSVDKTLEVLFAIRANFESGWIKIVEHKVNKGPSVARNSGWDVATQPYVAFLDADDTWHPRKIEIQLQYMQNHPDVFLTGHRYRWLKGQTNNLQIPPLPSHYKIYQICPWKMLFSNKLSTPTVMLRRDLHYRFDPTKKFSEDYLLWLSILFDGHKGAIIDLELTYLHKAPYGAKGLSGRFWAMERGELDTYWKLWQKGKIPLPLLLGFMPFSLAKYVRRIIKSYLWK